MMAAMVMHRQGGVGEVLHLGRIDLAHAVAGHELERLRRACQDTRFGCGSLEFFLPHLAAVGTLCGGLPEEIMSDCVRREKVALGCESVDTAIALQRLRDLLPDEGRAGIAPIRPDIVGEAFVLARLGNGQANEGRRAVLRAFADRPSEVAAVLVRCVQDFVPRDGDTTSAQDDHDRALAWLRAVGDAPDLPLHLLLVVLDEIPQQTLALRSLAVEWQRRAVELLREQAASCPDLRGELARNLNNFSVRLSEAGLREEALTIAGEAVELYRELATANPDAFRPVLTGSLNNLAIRHSNAGQRQEALTIAGEAVELYRELAAANPDAFRPDLAMSLNTLANSLSDAGQRQKALKIAGETAALYRELAAANPDAFRPDLASSLNNRAVRLSEAGQREEALMIAAEAVAIRRELAAANPDAFRPDLAMSLHNLASRLSEAGQHQKALTIAAEAATHYRELADANPDAFRPVLAASLNNLATMHSDAGQRQEALKIARESATIYWTLLQKLPEYFGNYFRIAMTTWLSLLHDIPRKEASSMFQQDPDAHVRTLFEDADDATDTSANEGA